jgi:nicotinamide phosphoribosyltransferase
MKLSKNIILNSDSYKYSQFPQYPKNAEYVYSYIESRGGQWDATVFFGLQAFIKEYLITPITKDDIDTAEAVITAHGEPFNRAGWEYILEAHGGKLPIVINAAPEGLIIPTKNVLATIENTDPECWWLTSFLETALLRAIWYPTTVATNSYESKKIILNYLEKTGDPSLIDFKLHDFSARGVSSLETAGLGSMAHLINFMGTDTVTGLLYAKEYYNEDMAGYSIPASEHSTITSWGRENEVDAYRNMIKLFGKPGAMFACVSDSYDIYEACKMWGTVLKDDVIKSGATLVVRPDSGEPSDVVVKCLYILEKYYGSVKNAKGFRVLNNVRVIQGDGIDHASIRSILFCMEMAGFSADNVAFGQGGALCQIVNRDTMRFACKCSSIGIREMVANTEENFPTDGKTEIKTSGFLPKVVWHDVYKDPVGDSGKKSKRGRVTLFQKADGEYYSGVEDWMTPVLQEVYRDGVLVKEYTFAEVRANSRK